MSDEETEDLEIVCAQCGDAIDTNADGVFAGSPGGDSSPLVHVDCEEEYLEGSR